MIDERQHAGVASEDDLVLLHALQVAPRAPWTLIGPVVGADPSTVARRWSRLQDERLAWFTAHASASLLSPDLDAALVEVSARPECVSDLARAVSAHPHVVAVDVVSGPQPIVFVVIGANLEEVRLRVAEISADENDIESTEITYLSRVHQEDAQWQLRVLSEGQKRALLEPQPDESRAVAPDLVAQMLSALDDDARIGFGELAQRLETSEATARRLLTKALNSGVLRLSCDLAAGAMGFGRAVLLDVDVLDPNAAGQEISRMSPVVRCAESVGVANLHLMARFPSLSHLAAFEADARERIPGWRVVRRRTVTRSFKRQGRLLDSSGRLAPLSSSSSR